MMHSPAGKLASLLLAACLAWLPAAPVLAQSLRIEPANTVLDGEPVRIAVDGLRANEEVNLHAERWYAGISMQPRPPQPRRHRRTGLLGTLFVRREVAQEAPLTFAIARCAAAWQTVVALRDAARVLAVAVAATCG